jgi:flagellar hook-basal body protein
MTVRSLFVGLTGLNAMSQGIDVISNNIANLNTVGFRAGRASFDDLFYRTLSAGVGSTENRGGVNPHQLGHGVTTGSIDTIFTQGSTQSTGRLLDLSIEGDGFFVLRDGAGQEFLTRAGNFTLDNVGNIVDPGTGLRLIGRQADEFGNLLDTEAEGELSIDFSRRSLARQTENVTARGNFDARVGTEGTGVNVSSATSSSTLTALFDGGGNPVGMINGDVIRFDSGFFDLGNAPENVQSPLALSDIDAGKGSGVILTVTSTTTLDDLQRALNSFFNTAVTKLTPGESSGLNFSYDDIAGNFQINSSGDNALKGVRLGLAERFGETSPPEEASRNLGNLFVNSGDPDFTRTLNINAKEDIETQKIRKADTTTSIDVFDSQGNSHTLAVGMARDTQPPAAIQNSLITELRDSQGRKIIPSDIIPAEPVYSDPVTDSRTNTATFTATQISNIVATQGVYSFQDGAGNLIGLRLSDGALSFNGGAFTSPVDATGTVLPAFATAGLDTTGEEALNVPSNDNPGGGLLGDQGFEATTTVEDIRSQLERRINAAISAVVGGIGNLDITAPGINQPPAITPTPPDNFLTGEGQPVKISLTKDGSFSFSVTQGSLGAPATDDADMAAALIASAGGEENMGLVLDLAAKTRSIRVSTVNPGPDINDTTDDQADGQIDDSFVGDNRITGFIKNADPFGDDVQAFFDIGDTDFRNFDTDGDPTTPDGIDDSGVHLIALSSGVFADTDNLDDSNFANVEAFNPEVTSFRALFNQRGFGISKDFNSDAAVDNTAGVPVGIVATSSDVSPFETNTFHTSGTTRNTVNFQAVVPSDFRTPPVNTTGTMIFDSEGRFQKYENFSSAPTITFDPDNNDPENGGVDPIPFKLDLSRMTYQFQSANVQLDTQDGRPVGNLDNVSIAANGEIIGVFTNGDTQSLGQIRLATVRNEAGLIQEGATMFTVAPNSGERIFADAGIDAGAINSGSLELSNVDLAQEFTNLIVVQRAYQANTRVITTGDQVIQEALSLKR